MALKIWGAGSNAGADFDWNNPANWDGDTLPVDHDSILVDETVTTNILTYAPDPSIFIENITVNSPSLTVYIGMSSFNSSSTISANAGVKVYGVLSSTIGVQNQIVASLMGVQDVIGHWSVLHMIAPSDYDQTLSMTDPNFDSIGNFLNFPFDIYRSNTVNNFQYGEFDVATNTVINKGVFNSLSYEAIGYTVGLFFLFSVKAVTINFNVGNCEVISGGSSDIYFEFSDTLLMNITNCNPDFFTRNMSLINSGSTYLCFPKSCIFNISCNGQFNGFQSLSMSSVGTAVFIAAGSFYAPPSTAVVLQFNLYNSTSFSLTTNPQPTATFSNTNSYATLKDVGSISGSFNILAYDNSVVVGAFLNGVAVGFNSMFPPNNLDLGLSGSINMYENSIYSGIIQGYTPTAYNGPVKFFDNSNYSCSYGGASWPPDFTTYVAPEPMIERTINIDLKKSSF